jgi:hypothetical protein
MDRPNGDPRDPNTDAADGVESIPFSHARNNVQQVMKNCRSIAPASAARHGCRSRPVCAAHDDGMSEANHERRIANDQRGSLRRRTSASVGSPSRSESRVSIHFRITLLPPR